MIRNIGIVPLQPVGGLVSNNPNASLNVTDQQIQTNLNDMERQRREQIEAIMQDINNKEKK